MRLTPAVFSHTGQIHEAFKIFVKEQIRLKFEAFEGEVKRSKVRSYMNWWIKCISAVIVKTASRNVTFKATRMRDSMIVEGKNKNRGDARLSIFVAHHLAPLARTYSAHRPSRNREIQR